MLPVVRALSLTGAYDQLILLTGKHPGLAASFESVPACDSIDLELDPRDLGADQLCAKIEASLRPVLAGTSADLALVQGDTASALAGARAAKICSIPIGHVEAGLRSFDLTQPWPEEGYRIEIDALADLLFAPTSIAAANLAAESAVQGRIHVTGNSGIDAVLEARDRCGPIEPSQARKIILVTCHRKENRGLPIADICVALQRLVDRLPVQVILPLHPNRLVRNAIEPLLSGRPHIHLIEPVEHQEMVHLMLQSWLILTDSGGLQEEGPALGRPVLVLRNVTERPEALNSQSIELVGTATAGIVAAVSALHDDEPRYARMATPCFPFGDRHAGPRIAAAIDDWFSAADEAVAV